MGRNRDTPLERNPTESLSAGRRRGSESEEYYYFCDGPPILSRCCGGLMRRVGAVRVRGLEKHQSRSTLKPLIQQMDAECLSPYPLSHVEEREITH